MAKQIIPFKVDDETTLFAEVEVIPPLEGMEVTPKRLTEAALAPVVKKIARISERALEAVKGTGATSGSVQFSVQLAAQYGVPQVFLVSGNGDLTITLNWETSKPT